jgi:hypothetical protein
VRIGSVERAVVGRSRELPGELLIARWIHGPVDERRKSATRERFEHGDVRSHVLGRDRSANRCGVGRCEAKTVLQLITMPVLRRPHRLDRLDRLDRFEQRVDGASVVPPGRRGARDPVERRGTAQEVAELPIAFEGTAIERVTCSQSPAAQRASPLRV